MEAIIHHTAEVGTPRVGEGTTIWQFVVVLSGASIGKNCNICSHVFIENDVEIGDRVTIKNCVQVWDGVRLEAGVFIGPNATFTNDLFPRSKQRTPAQETIVCEGASIGANATILCGRIIGRFAMVGAGSVVTKSIGPHELWIGNPARHVGYVTESGERLDLALRSRSTGCRFHLIEGRLVKE